MQRDSRNERQSWKHNPMVSQGDAALRQAVAPVMDWVRLQKNFISKFNDKGRPDHVTEWEDFQCLVTQDGERTRNASQSGDRSEVRFTVSWLPPAKLPIGAILIHETFGMMKIVSYDGMAMVGMVSAKAIGLNATETVEDGDVVRVEQSNIY